MTVSLSWEAANRNNTNPPFGSDGWETFSWMWPGGIPVVGQLCIFALCLRPDTASGAPPTMEIQDDDGFGAAGGWNEDWTEISTNHRLTVWSKPATATMGDVQVRGLHADSADGFDWYHSRTRWDDPSVTQWGLLDVAHANSAGANVSDQSSGFTSPLTAEARLGLGWTSIRRQDSSLAITPADGVWQATNGRPPQEHSRFTCYVEWRDVTGVTNAQELEGNGNSGSAQMFTGVGIYGDVGGAPTFDGSYIYVGTGKRRIRMGAGTKASLRLGNGNRFEV